MIVGDPERKQSIPIPLEVFGSGVSPIIGHEFTWHGFAFLRGVLFAEHQDPKRRACNDEDRYGLRVASIHRTPWAVLEIDPVCRRAWNDGDRCASHRKE